MSPEREPETVFIAGATGFTGRALVQHAVNAGHQVIAHVRPNSRRVDEWRATFVGWGAQVDTTPWELSPMTQTLGQTSPTLVFGLLGTTRSRAKDARAKGGNDSYETVDYGLTAMLYDAAVAAGLDEVRFVYLSSIGVKPGARSPYMAARAKVEAKLEAGPLNWTSARPSFITGPGRDDSRPMERIGSAFSDAGLGALAVIGGRRLRDRYRSTTPEELSRGLLRVALDPQAACKILESEQLKDD